MTSSNYEEQKRRRQELQRAGKCIRCRRPMDRAGVKSKNGHDAALCRGCLDLSKREAADARKAAQAKVSEMRRALGLPDEG